MPPTTRRCGSLLERSLSARFARRSITRVVATFALLVASAAHAQIKSFPQAEGFGAGAVGGRGGDVYHITSLLDNGAVGTLRHGIESAPTSGRTIVFDVGGWITLTSKLGIVKEKRNITIAGQTAPGGGIGVRGNQFSVGGDHIIVRHMRFRPGKGAGRVDSVGTNADAQHVIYDHVSAGFSYDENFSTQARDLTLQYSAVSYGLEDHSAGSLIEQAYRLSFHHNLYAHNNTRNPKARVNETLDWVNNVVYDYNNGFIAGDSDTTSYFWTANVDGNYYITGPGDTSRPMIRDGRAHNYGLYFGTNAYDNDGDAQHDGVVYAGNGVDATGLAGVVSGSYTWASAPYATPTIWKDASPQAAYQRVLSEFGATPWRRDEVDSRIHNNVVNRTGSLIARESDLAGVSNGGFGTLAAGVAPLDTDRDGIPDAWERKHGLPTNATSNNGDFDNDGYTNLEEYLNDLAAFAAPGPLEFDGTGRYADWNNWTRRWEPSRVDKVNVNLGTATVDAVGQKAGTLAIAAAPASQAMLNVASGWIEITDDLQVGAAGVGVVNHTGGELVVQQGGVSIDNGGYFLAGGRLATNSLAKGAGGAFNFTGGTLTAGIVEFDLQNNGGAIAPGAWIAPGVASGLGVTRINGDLTLASGALHIEIGGTAFGQFDRLEVAGVADLGGTLRVELLDLGAGSYAPQLGDQFPFLAASEGVGGAFAAFELPTLPAGLAWSLQPGDATLFLQVVSANPADFNHDGVVDGLDLAQWRDGFGATEQTNNNQGDADGNGVVDGNDFLVWQRNVGAGTGATTSAPVPEPSTTVLVIIAAQLALAMARRL